MLRISARSSLMLCTRSARRCALDSSVSVPPMASSSSSERLGALIWLGSAVMVHTMLLLASTLPVAS